MIKNYICQYEAEQRSDKSRLRPPLGRADNYSLAEGCEKPFSHENNCDICYQPIYPTAEADKNIYMSSYLALQGHIYSERDQ